MLCGAAVLLLAAFVLPSSVLAQQKGEAREYADLALTGDNVCTRCHDDPNIMKIGRIKHGTRADARTPTCFSANAVCSSEYFDLFMPSPLHDRVLEMANFL